MKRRRLARRALQVLALAVAAPCVGLGVLAVRTPFPQELAADSSEQAQTAERNSVRITDRSGTLLVELRDEQGRRHRRLELAGFGTTLPKAVIAAEDGRFYSHPGVDPIAVTRALGRAALGDGLSGASTLTQQLARAILHAPRSARGKLSVVALALRIEMELPKDKILEAYLNEIEFGVNMRGAEAAAWAIFDKPARDLSLGEAAALASIPRGTSLYDPVKQPENLRRRRDRVLDRMLEQGLAQAAEVTVAKGEPIVLSPRFRGLDAPHFAHAVASGALGAPLAPGAVEVRTTLIGELQREIQQAARVTVRDLADRGVSAASVVVLDNASGDILAYVGSPDASDALRLGGNDGVRALRQPGSALKPFVYELAFERLGMSPASLVPDVELSFASSSGDVYRPKNYDEHFHGPVLVRQSLGNSYNVPAVFVAERLGVESLLERLHALGFASLDRPADEYGLALALGDGEVTLLELATAYATLGRGGARIAPRAVVEWRFADGRLEPASPAEQTQVLSPVAAAMIVDVLRDKRARASSFGEETVFDLPFQVAAKTGTSKGFRDNVAVGFTTEVTVAVWVGNFDGSPMRGVSGITGAGPLFSTAMLAAAGFAKPGRFTPPAAETYDICPLSGKLAGPHCPSHRREWMNPGTRVGECDMHEHVVVDRLNGLRAGPACKDAIESRPFETFPSLYVGWAQAARRNLAPELFSPRCPGAAEERSDVSVRVLYPEDGARFFLEGDRSAHVRARATFPAGAKATFVIDGAVLAADAIGRATVALTPGSHTLVARTGSGSESATIRFTVE